MMERVAAAAFLSAAIFFLERVEADGGVAGDAVKDAAPAARAPGAMGAATALAVAEVGIMVADGACNDAEVSADAAAARWSCCFRVAERVDDDGRAAGDAADDTTPAVWAPEAVGAATAGVEVEVATEVVEGVCNGAAAPCAGGTPATFGGPQ